MQLTRNGRIQYCQHRQRIIGKKRRPRDIKDRSRGHEPRAEGTCGEIRIRHPASAVVLRVLRNPLPATFQIRISLDDALLDLTPIIGPVDPMSRRFEPSPETAALHVRKPPARRRTARRIVARRLHFPPISNKARIVRRREPLPRLGDLAEPGKQVKHSAQLRCKPIHPGAARRSQQIRLLHAKDACFPATAGQRPASRIDHAPHLTLFVLGIHQS